MEEILSSIKRIIAEEGDESAPLPRASRRGRLEIVPPVEVAEVETLELGEEAKADNDDVLELVASNDASIEEASFEAIEPDEAELIELTPPEPVAEVEAVEEVAEEIEPAAEIETPEIEAVEIGTAETEVGEIAVPEAEAAETEAVIVEEEPEEVLELTDTVNMEEAVSQSTAKAAPETILSVESEVAARHSLSALSSMIVTPESGDANTLEGLVQAMLRPMLKEWLDANLPQVVEKMVAKEITRITGGVR